MTEGFWSLLVQCLTYGLFYSCSTSLIVHIGLLASAYLRASGADSHRFDYDREVYANWDGQWYKEIAQQGYRYDSRGKSNIAFFPGYPLVARGVAWLGGITIAEALLIASNVFLLISFCLMVRYVDVRYPSASPHLAAYVLVALGVLPTTLFFRLAYSESMFLALTVLTLYAIVRRWPLLMIATIVGLATATRPVGLALLPPLLLDAWRRSPGARVFLLRAAYVLPIGCGGFIAYMVYQQVVLGDFLAFAHAQEYWRLRPSSGLGERLLSLGTLEPVWSAYVPSGKAYWAKFAGTHDPLFSLRAADPLYFVGAVILVIVGAVKRWLSDYEVVAASGLLLIPYATIGYEQYMQSMARYSSSALPIYLVLGHLLCRLPPPAVAALAGVSGFLLGVYSAMFGAGYLFI